MGNIKVFVRSGNAVIFSLKIYANLQKSFLFDNMLIVMEH